jgi:predicted ATP-grasp superfamily ATP-dependent carboligase
MTRQRRILVTDAQDRQGLEAIRSLHRAGFKVTGVASSRLAPGLWSRACSTKRVFPAPAAGIEFIARLEALVREDKHDVLIPGTDESLYAISAHRDRLAPYIELGLPGHDVVTRALDKRRLATEADRVGFAGPAWYVCKGSEEAMVVARRFGFPVLVKAVNTIAPQNGGLTRYPSRLVLDESALRNAQMDIGTSIVQRRERGRVISFCGIATDRGMLASVVARHHRLWPPEAGDATFSETIIPSRALSEQVQTLVAAIGWLGPFQLELIETEHGVVKPIDFNPRLYGSLPLASAAGAPLAALWCGWLLGQNSPPATARTGVAYRWEDADARHILWLLRGGHLRAGARALRPRRGTAHAYFRARDPLPLAMRAVELGQHRWRRRRARTGAAG